MAIETLGAALRHIDRLFADGAVTGLSDAQLLERFVGRHDITAFEAMVARHGPMVLSVCRGILRDPNDAEDAFQAVFLVLVKKAGTIRGRVILGGWLYRVAHRAAIEANRAAARRRARERQVAAMAAAMTSSGGPSVPDDLLPALHEEIARLPEKYRLPVVLCDLEGLPQAEAAGQLRWSERTLRRRLAEARDRLKTRLTRRGLAPGGVALGAVFVREARAAVPTVWSHAAVRAALHSVDPSLAAGSVSAAARSLSQEVLKTMLVRKLTITAAALLGAGMLTWGASAALISQHDGPGKANPAPATRRSASPAPQQQGDSHETDATFPVRGRVFDPDGKPAAGAEIFVRPFARSVEDPAGPGRKGQRGRVTASGADGRFRFDLDKASSDWLDSGDPAWHHAQIAAVAPGLAPAWVEAGSLLGGDEATLRLVPDDVSIRGRVVDSQGRSIAGATVKLRRIGTFHAGADLDALLASGELDVDRISAWFGENDAIWPGGTNTWTTDADGRFEVKGVGRDRVGFLGIGGPKLARSTFYAMARPTGSRPKPRPHPTGRSRERMFNGSYGPPPAPMLVGASFEHVAGPTKPIEGVVRSKATGQPVAGVHVSGQEGATWTWASAVTDARGRFRLVGLPKGQFYQVTANQGYDAVGSFLGAEITVSDTEGLKPIETTIDLPAGVTITGRLIVAATGRPVVASQVNYCGLPGNRNPGNCIQLPTSPTDPTFRLIVPPGEGMLYVSAGQQDLYTRARLRKADKGRGVGGQGDGETITVILNGCHAYRIIDVPADARSFHVDLELTRGINRKGRVVDPDGKPVVGAQCYGLSPTWGSMKTLESDAFEVRGLEPDQPRELIFAHKGRRLVGSAIIEGEDGRNDGPITVRLVPPGSIKGRLVDEDGLPMAGALIDTMTIGLDGSNLPPGPGRGMGGNDAIWPDSEVVVAGADGRFQVDGLKPGIKTISSVLFKDRPEHWGDTGKTLRDIVIQRPGEVRDLGDIQVKVVPSAQ